MFFIILPTRLEILEHAKSLHNLLLIEHIQRQNHTETAEQLLLNMLKQNIAQTIH